VSDDPKYVGWATMTDGTHRGITSAEAENLWKAIDDRRADRALAMPDEQSAIKAMFSAYDRLRELGWREGIYAPKDGSKFQIIEGGSTGVFECHYSGAWPNGYWMTVDDRDCYPSSSAPLLYRMFPDDEAKQKAKMAAAAEAFRKERDAPHD
jgi:hypothetical protein